MSVAFRRESDEEHLEPKFELPIPPGPTLVTARGQAQIRARVAELEARYQVPLLARLPLDAAIRQHADSGRPSVVAGDAAAPLYQQLGLQVIQRVAALPQRERDARRIF